MGNDLKTDKTKDPNSKEAELEKQRQIEKKRLEEALEKKRQEAYEQKLIEEQRIAQERSNEKLTSTVPSIVTEGENGSHVARDEKGKVTETKDENGLVRKFSWEGENLTSFTDDKGKQWASKDGTNWTSEGEKDRTMKVVVNAQDGSLAVVENTQKNESLLNTQRDANNRIASGTDVNGVTRQFAYNDKGEVTTFTDAEGKTWTSADGKTYQSEGEPPRSMRVSVNQNDGTLTVGEAARLSMKMVDGKELIRTNAGTVLKDKDGKVIETSNGDESKRTKITYENGKVKTITLSDGKAYSSTDSVNFSGADGSTMRNVSVTDSGKITYVSANGDVMSMTAAGQQPKLLTSRHALETAARNIAYAMNGGIGAGTDRVTMKAELDKLSEPAREELKRLWTEMHKKSESNFDYATLDEEFVDETSGSELEELRSKLNKKDGKEDVTGRVTTALTALGEVWPDLDSPTYEKNIRELVGTLDSKSIEQYDKEFQDKHGTGILKSVQDNPNVSQTTKDAMSILIKGQDKRTDEDTINLVNLALKGGNIDLLQETMRTASEKARQALAADPTLKERLEKAFSIPDEHGGYHVDNNKVAIATDYLKSGRLSVATEIKLNTSAGGDNEKAIDTALMQMSEKERIDYQKGKQLATSGGDASTMSDADKAALFTYKDINSALNAAGYPYEVNRWESKITNSKDVSAFIDSLYAHRGCVYNSDMQDISKTVEEMPEAVWKRLHDEKKEGKTVLRDQIIAAYNSYEFDSSNTEKVKALTDILDKKINTETFKAAEESGRRDIFTALDQSKGYLDDDETSGLKALQKMTPEEKEKYRNDPEFRARLDEAVKVFGRGLNDDIEYDAALKTLERIKNKQSTDDVLLDLYTYASENSVNEAEVIRRVQEAFRKDPTLFEKIKNPATPEEKQYAEDFKAIMPKALGGWYDADYEIFGKQLVETGHLEMFRSQYLNRGDFDDDEYGAYKSILYADKEETSKLLNDKSYRDNVMWFMSEEERKVAVNNLKERDRQQAEISVTQQKFENTTDEQEKEALKKRLEHQKQEIEKLFSGEMRPEDDIYASMLGAGTDEDRLQKALAKVPPERIPQVLNDLSAKYNVSLPGGLVSELGGPVLANALRKIRPHGTSQQEDFVYALDEYSNSRGFGAEFVRNAWDGTADQTDKEFNDFAAEISNAYRLGTEMPESERREQLERLAERIDNLVESKEALGNLVADVVIIAVAVVATGFGQPEAMGLLAFTSFAGVLGLSGAALKVAIKQAIMGNNYSSEMMYADLATGFTDAAINAMGPGHISALLSVGKQTSARSAVKITEKLLEKGLIKTAVTTGLEEGTEQTVKKGSKLVTVALENGSGQADNKVLKEVNSIIRNAMTSGAQKLDDRAIQKASLRLVDQKVAKEAYEKAIATGGTKIAATQASQKATDEAAAKIALVMKESLIEEVKLSQSTLQRYVTNATFNAANGAVAGGSSGTLYASTNFDSSKSLSENLEMIAKAGLTSALIGGIMGGGMSTAMKGVSEELIPSLRANNTEIPPNALNSDEATAALLRDGELTVSNRSAGSSTSAYVLEAKIKTKQGDMDVVVDAIKGTEGERRLAYEIQAKRIDKELGFNNAPITESRTAIIEGVETKVRIQEKRGVDISEELYVLKDAKEKELGRKLSVKELLEAEPQFKRQVEQALVERMVLGDVEMHTRNFTIDYPNGRPRFNNIDIDKGFSDVPLPVLTHDYALNNDLIRAFADHPISNETVAHLKAFLKKHDTPDGRAALFSSHFTDDQIEAVMARTRWLADNGKMPKTSSMYELAMMQVELQKRKAIELSFKIDDEIQKHFERNLDVSVETASVQQRKMTDA
ncbi:MAG: hypothetical protein C0469_00350, partial [Cyanobacteria bacterium DS2.3.42]|nr:hypothetical protein [Cyanobacteria bacterium DS2.3.42]